MSGVVLDDRGIHLNGDAWLVEQQGRQLSLVADNIQTVRGLLYDVTVHGVWESSSGQAFEDRVGMVPRTLQTFEDRYREAADLLHPYADDLRETKVRLRRLEREHEEASLEYDRLQARHAEMEPGPEREDVGRRADDCFERLTRMEETYVRVVDEAFDRDQRLHDDLRAVADIADDSRLYDALESSSRIGDWAQGSTLGQLAPGASLLGLPGDLGRRTFYGESSYRQVATVHGWRVVDVGAGKVAVGAKWAAKVPVLNEMPLLASARHRARHSEATRTTRTAGTSGSTRSVASVRSAAPLREIRSNPVATTRWGRVKQGGTNAARSTGSWARTRATTHVKKESGYTAARESLDSWTAVVGTNRVAEWATIASGSTRVARGVYGGSAKQVRRVDAVVHREERSARRQEEDERAAQRDRWREEGADRVGGDRVRGDRVVTDR